MISNILVPLDGSGHARKALELAADLAAGAGARMHLVHVLLRGPVPEQIRKLSDKPGRLEPPLVVGAAYIEASLPRDVLEDIAAKVLEEGRRVATEKGVKEVETAWVEGDPARAILEQAAASGADMIVMGSRGLSNLKGLLVGSVSHKVQHLFEGTVVTVK